MNKKSYYLFLIILLNVVFPGAIKAASWQDYGNYDITWYSSQESEFSISTASQLAGVAYLVNNGFTDFHYKCIKIDNDINLSGKTWVPIGSAAYSFKGKFDGNDKIISGIDINKNSSPSPFVRYGFFGDLNGATICNLSLKGNLLFKIENYYPEQYVGGLAAKSHNSEITSCHSELLVCYDRERASNEKYIIYVGGLVGYSVKNKFCNCSYIGDLKAAIGGLTGTVQSDASTYLKNSEIYLAGICAYDDSSKITDCSVEIPQYLLNIIGSANSVMSKRTGTLVGNSSRSAIHNSRAIVDDVIIRDRGSKPSTTSFNGLSALPQIVSDNSSCGIFNCYSVIRNMEFVAGTTTTSSVYYGGISASKFYDSAAYKYKSNYSNSDYYLNSYSIPNYLGYMGLTTFNSRSMKTKEFCDELNLYFTLNGEEAKWIQGDDGYPVIKDKNSTGIDTISQSVKNSKYTVFNISGVCVARDASIEDINKLSPGVYIVNGKKLLLK